MCQIILKNFRLLRKPSRAFRAACLAALFFYVEIWVGLKWGEWYYVEYGTGSFVRLNCALNYYNVLGVHVYGSAHPCAEFIDEYRFLETSAMGFNPLMYGVCEEVKATALRPLTCMESGYPVVVPLVGFFEGPGRSWDDGFRELSFEEVRRRVETDEPFELVSDRELMVRIPSL